MSGRALERGISAAHANAPSAERDEGRTPITPATADAIMSLQRAVGNTVVARLIAPYSTAVQRPGAALTSAQLMRHPAASVLRRAGRWLFKRGEDMISKHIAKHARRIAGRATHSVFRLPRNIKSHVRRAIREGEALARNATAHGADDVLEGPGIRVYRQATRTPGKFRTVVEREFRSDIGTRGERILKIVIDASGRLVTAYPVQRFTALGLGAGAVAIFDARTAEAAERIRSRIEAEDEEEDYDILTTIIDFIFDPSVANEGEDLGLAIDRIIERTTRDLVSEIEEEEGVCLTAERREEIQDMMHAAISIPMLLEESD